MYLLLELQRRAGISMWRAGIVAAGVGVLALFGLDMLHRLPAGHRGRPWAAWTLWGSSAILSLGVLVPLIQVLNLAGLKTPIVVVTASLPPVILFLGVALMTIVSTEKQLALYACGAQTAVQEDRDSVSSAACIVPQHQASDRDGLQSAAAVAIPGGGISRDGDADDDRVVGIAGEHAPPGAGLVGVALDADGVRVDGARPILFRDGFRHRPERARGGGFALDPA